MTSAATNPGPAAKLRTQRREIRTGGQMPMSAAERARLYRQRAAAEMLVLPIELHGPSVFAALIEADLVDADKFLKASDASKRRMVARGLSMVIRSWLVNYRHA